MHESADRVVQGFHMAGRDQGVKAEVGIRPSIALPTAGSTPHAHGHVLGNALCNCDHRCSCPPQHRPAQNSAAFLGSAIHIQDGQYTTTPSPMEDPSTSTATRNNFCSPGQASQTASAPIEGHN